MFGVCCLWVYVCFFAISGWVVNLIVWLVVLGNLLVCLCLTWRVVSGFYCCFDFTLWLLVFGWFVCCFVLIVCEDLFVELCGWYAYIVVFWGGFVGLWFMVFACFCLLVGLMVDLLFCCFAGFVIVLVWVKLNAGCLIC